MDVLDTIEIGRRIDLGGYLFTAEAIVAFAERYDPQPFHVDAEAARDSLFGGLCATGWHTTAAWMKKTLENQTAERERRTAEGLPPLVLGPSPGVKNLKWFRPVYAGDTVRFFNTAMAARRSETRPGWGVIETLSEGFNQHEEPVMAFASAVLVKL